MAYTYDETTHAITIPRGDTVTINVTVTGDSVADGDAVLFRVRRINNLSQWAITKQVTIADGAATIRLASADTRELKAGSKYGWSLGYVKGVDEDADNNPISNDATDDVLTLHNRLYDFKVVDSGILGVD